MSATFNEDVQTLKELVLHNPVRAQKLCLELQAKGQSEDFASQRKPLVFWVGPLSLNM
jgi:superfamily II DNA/RNA helicase